MLKGKMKVKIGVIRKGKFEGDRVVRGCYIDNYNDYLLYESRVVRGCYIYYMRGYIINIYYMRGGRVVYKSPAQLLWEKHLFYLYYFLAQYLNK